MKKFQQKVSLAFKSFASEKPSLAILQPGKDLKSDHKGFTDPAYLARRHEIADIAKSFSINSKQIPKIAYTSKEHKTWQAVYDLLIPLHARYACEEHNKNFEELVNAGIITRHLLPQLQPISEYIHSNTGFRLIPVTGMLTQKDFFALLARKMFPATQFIRHHSDPFYSPEPDVVHEILGHMPMLANKDYADFFQLLGKASLNASEKEIDRLGNLYLFSVEFGLIKENKNLKIYGAGILSSAKEIMNVYSENVRIRHFEPEIAGEAHCPLSALQNQLFWSHSLAEVKEKMTEYVEKWKDK